MRSSLVHGAIAQRLLRRPRSASGADRILRYNKIRTSDRITVSIIKLVSIREFILAIYYTPAEYYQYSIIDDYGVVLETDDIFFSSEAAERDGREAINIVSS